MRLKIFIMAFLVVSRIGQAGTVQMTLPDISVVHKMALNYARINPEDLSDLKRRSRRAAILPTFQIGAKRAIQNNVNVAIDDNVSVTSAGTEIGPTTSNIKQDSNDDISLEVKAVWSLNELIYNPDTIDVTQEARYQMRERRLLLAEVNKRYFELEKLIKFPDPKESPKKMDLLKDELIADLDAMTGGWFGEQIDR
ncbi:MAG: hypothetical protein COV46_07520 [Deltaproteobacteria bacterium CG11_big_fil_rev_8_21_14_0_20_49_13]|nr:MAG: hypothetical protein COV46_07520 [Deltaproteobacteria bacterium CG11_big_fil_rev_8_21_14_0_20_49_13]